MMVGLMVLMLLADPGGDDAGAPLAVGQQLPALKGEFLTGREATLPEAARGKIALVALGFTYDSRIAVEAWTKRFSDEFGPNPETTYYEVPVIGGLGRLGKWFINRGMRNGTPRKLHENVITVYGGVDPWKRRVRFQKPNDAYLILLDREGAICWLHQGAWDEAVYAELRAEVSKHLG